MADLNLKQFYRWIHYHGTDQDLLGIFHLWRQWSKWCRVDELIQPGCRECLGCKKSSSTESNIMLHMFSYETYSDAASTHARSRGTGKYLTANSTWKWWFINSLCTFCLWSVPKRFTLWSVLFHLRPLRSFSLLGYWEIINSYQLHTI